MIERILERFVQRQMIETKIPGLSLAIVRGGDAAMRHFGFRDLSTRKPPGPDTRYGIGSVTKVVTAIAVMQLVAEGKVELDAPLSALVPSLGTPFAHATVRQVMAHASGLPALGWSETKMSRRWPMDGFPVSSYDDLAVFMDGAATWRTAAPGDRWQYSNEGYLALGHLIEQCDGTSYAEAVQRRVLDPLGMTRSTFDDRLVSADPDRVAPVMHDVTGAFVPGSNLLGVMPAAGGLVSTARDLISLARLFLTRGLSPSGERLLPAELVSVMAEPDVWIDDGDIISSDPIWADPRRSNGPGLQRHVNVEGTDVWAHGGGVMGGTAYLAVAPERDTAVIVLANTHGYPLAQLALAAMVTTWGGRPEDLSFVRRRNLLDRCGGRYASFGATIEADVAVEPWGLRLTFDLEPSVRTVSMLLHDYDADADVARFLVLGSGRPSWAELAYTTGRTELRFERYALRRIEPGRGEVDA